MTEYSTLQCDGGCGAIITELGWARVELTEGWSRNPYDTEDYCPSCTAAMATEVAGQGAERGEDESGATGR